MEWTPEAEAAIKKVPFFVRKRVRTRVEKEAREAGKTQVTLTEVRQTQKRYLSGMETDIKGYQIDTCFGPGGCPNRAIEGESLAQKIEAIFEKEDLLSVLKQRVKENLKFHHEFRVSVADCPNACSQPQIKDIGIIGAAVPLLSDEICTLCEACVDACRENAVALDSNKDKPDIDLSRCIKCGQCINACPTGTIEPGTKGYRIQLGGKLGRHPRLGRELQGIFSEDQVLEIVKDCILFYKKNSRHGERFAEILDEHAFEAFQKKYGN